LTGSQKSKRKFTSTINGIAIIGIAISVAVMIISVSIVTGFKQQIRNKVIGFGAHIHILNYDSNLSYQTEPVPANPSFLQELKNNEDIDDIQPFAIKAGIIKTDENIQGLVLKGIGPEFNWEFFTNSLIDGKVFHVNDSAYSNQILISSFVARKMNLKTGDSFQMWFIDKQPRVRKFQISGIYETSLAEFDETYALVDIKHVQRLNNWDRDRVSGHEITIKNFRDIEDITWKVRESTINYTFDDQSRIKIRNIIERYPQIFDWLDLQDLNVMIIIILMLLVAGFNMVSGLLILILDRSYMIGVLKALGAKNILIRKVFLYQSGYLIVKGLFWGNFFGVGLSFLQKRFEIISLDPVNYYLTTVPVNLDLVNILLVNVGAMVSIMLFLVLPSLLVSRISPARVIRFD